MATFSFSRYLKSSLRWAAYFVIALVLFTSTVWMYQAYESGSTELDHQRRQSFVLTNVSVVHPGFSKIGSDQAIVIHDGFITAIQPMSAELPNDLPHLDGGGGFVIPGLIDSHVHILDRSYAKSALAAGVTTVRNMGGFNYHLKWRDELQRGEWFGSHMVIASPIMNSVEQGDPLSHFRVNDPQLARRAVRDFIAQGYDLIKVYEGLNAETYAAILDEAKHLQVAVAGHPSYALLARNALAHGGLHTFEHTEEIYDGFLAQSFSDELAAQAGDFFVEQDLILVPTLAVNRELTRLSNEKETYLSATNLAGINPFVRFIYQQTSFQRWLSASSELAQYNLEVDAYLHALTEFMHKRGVVLALGSDAGALTGLPGPATLHELELLVEAGLSPAEALVAATENAAKALQLEQRMGQVAVGYQADLVVLSVNPLDDLSALHDPQFVIQQGRVFDQADLNQLRVEALQHSNWLLSVARHLSHLAFGS